MYVWNGACARARVRERERESGRESESLQSDTICHLSRALKSITIETNRFSLFCASTTSTNLFLLFYYYIFPLFTFPLFSVTSTVIVFLSMQPSTINLTYLLFSNFFSLSFDSLLIFTSCVSFSVSTDTFHLLYPS